MFRSIYFYFLLCLIFICYVSSTDMECSVGRCVGSKPLELTVSAVAVLARGDGAPSDLAEEAEP